MTLFSGIKKHRKSAMEALKQCAFYLSECIQYSSVHTFSVCVCAEVVLDTKGIFEVEQCTNESTGDRLLSKRKRERKCGRG